MKKIFIALILVFLASCDEKSNEVNIYSSQSEHLIRPILDKFAQETGIKVNVTTGGKSELVSKLEFEKKNTKADLLLTSDIGNIYTAKEKGLLQAVDSQILNNSIPSNLRDSENFWFGITKRVRAIFYNKKLMRSSAVKSYLDISKGVFRKKILVRSSNNVYNQSLVASIIAQYGETTAKNWLKNVVANFARDPQGGDTDQLKALAVKEGIIAIANTYYYGRLIGDDENLRSEQVANNVGIIIPTKENGGPHVNIRGGGVTKYAKNKENAVKLLEYLVSKDAQEYFATVNIEYPVVKGAKIPQILQDFGEVSDDFVSLEEIGKNHKKAIELMQQAGWK